MLTFYVSIATLKGYALLAKMQTTTSIDCERSTNTTDFFTIINLCASLDLATYY